VVSQARLGAIYHYATPPRQARYNQLAYLRTVRAWRDVGRFGPLQAATDDDPALAFEFSWRRTGVGPEGYPDGFEITYGVNPDHAAGSGRDVRNEFGAALVAELVDAVEAAPPKGMNIREFGVFLAARTGGTEAAADAFGLDAGAVDGIVAGVETELEAGDYPHFAATLERYPEVQDVPFALTTALVGELSEAELPVALTEDGYVSYAPDAEQRG
jgi:hypothetical protein